MAETQFRLWLGDRSASEDDLARVEEIVVEQTMDQAWEARLRLSLSVDEQGRWQDRKDTFNQPFSRVRVELGLGSQFTALIDGPVVSVDTDMNSQPGRSSVTLVVNDDSVLLDRVEDVQVHEQDSEDGLARELFAQLPQITQTRIQSPGGDARVLVRRGTPMAFLTRLARARNWHAYVLPGDSQGTSIGCFQPDPAGPATLPPLTLMGADRSLAELQVKHDGTGPETTRAFSLSISDQQAVSADTSQQEQSLLRDVPAVAADKAAVRLLAPEEADPAALAGRTAGRSGAAAFAYRLTAKVVPDSYGAVLSPYNKVSLRAGDSPLSGDWLLTKVTHRITPSIYTQELEAKSDSSADPGAPADAAGGPGGLSAGFSASLSLF